MKKTLSIIFTVIFMLTCIPGTFASSSGKVVFVATDGSGDFNCDGVDDQVEINQALDFVAQNPEYSTVYLKAGTYIIDDTIYISSNTILKGDKKTVLTIKDGAIWQRNVPMIKQKNPQGERNITITGFTIDGNKDNLTQGYDASGTNIVNINSGSYYHTMMDFTYCENITVSNMYLTNNHNDALKVTRCHYIYYYNNIINQIGHDGLYASNCTNLQVYNNEIICRINCGIRLYNSDIANIYNNKIWGTASGGAGIQIQKYGTGLAMTNIRIYNNHIYSTNGPALWIFGGATDAAPYKIEDAYVEVFNNQIYDGGTHRTGNKRFICKCQ